MGHVPSLCVLCSLCYSRYDMVPKTTPIYGELYSEFPQRLRTCIIPQMQKTCPILAGTKYSKISSFYKKGHPLKVEDTYMRRALQWLSTETVYLHYSTNAEGMHYSSWEVSRESQSSPLWFFVESNATDHQEVSFFSEKKSVRSELRTRDLEPRIVSPDHPATVTYLFYYYYLHNL